MTTVYLLHFDPPYKHAGHYVGVTHRDDVMDRVGEHQRGEGARLCRVARREGSLILLARTWENVERKFEMKIKGRGLKPLCPICQGNSNGANVQVCTS